LVRSRLVVKLRGGPAARAAGPGDLLRRHGLLSARPLFPPRRTPPARLAARAARAPAGAVAPELGAIYVVDTGAQSAAQRARTLARLKLDPQVEYAEEDRPVRAFFTPNDPLYPQLYGLAKIGAPSAWDTARGSGVVVAVVDTGLDFTHPDIDANVWTNPGEVPGNGIDDDGNGLVDDWRGWDFVGDGDNDPRDENGHGTHVAGTVAAEGNNGLGVIGVAWQARVMAVRALDADGSGEASGLAAAIVYATDEGADVINASWGGEGVSQVMADAIDHAVAQGVVFVAAAGNGDVDAVTIFPANHPRAITVSAIDSNDQKADFSNFGGVIDVAAPGVGILSLENGTGGYIELDGTSQAAPHVSGVAALVLGRHPTFSVEQVRQALRFSATDLGPAGRDPAFGYGRLNAAGAVALNQVLEAKILSPGASADLAGPTAVTGIAQGPGFARYVLDFGAGESPTTWTTILESTTPVSEGALGTLDPRSLPEGSHTLRLRSIDTSGRTFEDRVIFKLRYVAIDAPAAQALAEDDVVWKSGAPLAIVGRAGGPGFTRYRIEWAPGRAATSGWSSTGVVLAGGGTSPVVDATLGTWTSGPTQAGPFTLRLSVDAGGRTTTVTTSLYLERELLGPAWPLVFPDQVRYEEGLIPVRQGDGSLRLLTCGQVVGLCAAYAADGSARTAVAGVSAFGPAVGELDASPGDEVVIAVGGALRIYAADLTLLREIALPGGVSAVGNQLLLADLDGDGSLEILALADGETTRQLYVYRANGQPFGGQFPRAIDSLAFEPPMLAVDLDGDGRREVLVLEARADQSAYRLRAFRADGSTYLAWNASYVAAVPQARLVAADLDHDGQPEVLVHEQDRLR
ncbi:MAG TPA: S8 family serine peptidase, partial [Acidimicrobiales bacterium]|nr:S8 family serine peptidase [Acidimicrobiales bacterium]